MYVDKYEEKVNTILRITIGFVFLYASLTKLFFEQPFYGFTNAATFLILLIGLVELIVGIFLVVGLFTRLVSIVGAVMVSLYVLLSIPAGLFHDYFMWKDIAILGGLIVLSLEREYLYSIDELLAKEHEKHIRTKLITKSIRKKKAALSPKKKKSASNSKKSSVSSKNKKAVKKSKRRR